MAMVEVNRGDATEDSEKLRNQMNQIHKNELASIGQQRHPNKGMTLMPLRSCQ